MPVRSSSLRVVAAVTVISALGACSGDGDDPADVADATNMGATTPPAMVATPADGSLFPPGDVDAGLLPWVELATNQLASALGVETTEVSTVSAVLVVWPDASLGCPEPDQQYAAALTDGAVIELEAGGAVYRFHAGGERGPFLCERPITSAPPRG